MNLRVIGLLVLFWVVVWTLIEFMLIFFGGSLLLIEPNPLILGLEIGITFVIVLFVGWLIIEEITKNSRKRKLEENFKYFS